MLTVQGIINAQSKITAKPGEEDLRGLPYKFAFTYGRVSSPRQIRDSKESIREIAHLIDLAKKDGYKTNLDANEIEKQLLSYSDGAIGVWQDGEVIVDVRDLGLSGQLSADERKGLEHLQQSIEKGIVGAVYLTEGVSRLSRDRDRILPYQLLKLLKKHSCRVRTPHGVWNPVIERDEEYLADEFEDSIGELRVMNKRLYRRRVQKAERGEYVGGSVAAGLYLPITGRKPNGLYEYDIVAPYLPHCEVVKSILEEYIRQNGSDLKTTRALNDLVFPFFPQELQHMETITALRTCPRDAGGYHITPALIRGMVSNLALIGVWKWGNQPPIVGHHPNVVPEELFLEAYALGHKHDKPKGRAANYEPQAWSGLLICMNHDEPHMVHSQNAAGRYACDYHYNKGGEHCLDIGAKFIDEPLDKAVLLQLDFSPYTEEVLSKLESEVKDGKTNHLKSKQSISRLEQDIARWKALLPCCVDTQTGVVDKEREAFYWGKIREAQRQLEEFRSSLSSVSISPSPDFAQVRKFLNGLPNHWYEYSSRFRNRLLKLIIDHVELRGINPIEATIVWKADFRQQVIIHRHRGKRDSLTLSYWRKAEDDLLKKHYPDSPPEVIISALPDRTWKAITRRACNMGLRRIIRRQPAHRKGRWTIIDDQHLKEGYESEKPVPLLAKELDRSLYSVQCRAAFKKLTRPSCATRQQTEVFNTNDNPTSLQQSLSGRGSGCGSLCSVLFPVAYNHCL